MPIIITEMQEEAAEMAAKMLTTFIIIAGVMITFFIILVFCMMRGRRNTMGGNVKEGEKSVYFSGYGKAKKNTRKEKPIQSDSSKLTKICKSCGNFVTKDAEICSFCGSTEF